MSFGWLPFTLMLFAAMRPKAAAAASLILGWLFLPGAVYDFPGIPDYTKITATCFPILLGTFLFDFQRLTKLYPSKMDIPIIVLCCCAFVSSLSNGLGVYDGFSGVLRQIFEWGFAYAIGKMYFSDQEGLHDLAKWIVIGGLIYIPFCLWEMRMAPTLHEHLYGFRTDRFATSIRFAGYRPTVFLQHGTAVGIWMMSSVLMGIWLWRTKTVEHLGGIPMGLLVSTLLIIFLLCRSLNSIVLFAGGLVTYHLIRFWGLKSTVLCLALIPVFYIVSRNTEVLTTDRLVEIAEQVSEDRAQSLYGRLYHEERLAEKAWEQPWFGWGGWGRNRVYDEQGEDTSVTDGLWVLTFGIYGLVGLVSLGLVLLLPTVVFWRRFRLADWGQPDLAPMAGFACILPLYVIDCLMNAMVNPIYTVAAGGILAWLANQDRSKITI